MVKPREGRSTAAFPHSQDATFTMTVVNRLLYSQSGSGPIACVNAMLRQRLHQGGPHSDSARPDTWFTGLRRQFHCGIEL